MRFVVIGMVLRNGACMVVEPKHIASIVEEALRVSERQAAVSIDPAVADSPRALSKELIRVPSDLAYYNSVYSDVLEYHIQVKRSRDRIEAERMDFHRTAEHVPDVRVTDAMVRALAETDPKVITAQEQVDVAEVWKSRLSGVVDAIRSKEKSLASLSFLTQAELRASGRNQQGGGDPREDPLSERERRTFGR